MKADDAEPRKPASHSPHQRPPWKDPPKRLRSEIEQTVRPQERSPLPRRPADPDVKPQTAPLPRRESAPQAEPEPAAQPSPVFRLVRGDQFVLGLLVLVVFGLMCWQWAQLSGVGARPVEVERFQPQTLGYRIDLNRATRVELIQLDGIGETLADRIIADREEHGPFANVDDLRRVKGIGPKTVEKVRRYVKAGEAARGR